MSSLDVPLPASFSRSSSPAIPGAWPGTPHKEPLNLLPELPPSPNDSHRAASDAYSSIAEAQSLGSVNSTLAPQESVSTLWSKHTSTSLTLSTKGNGNSETVIPASIVQHQVEPSCATGHDGDKLQTASPTSEGCLSANSHQLPNTNSSEFSSSPANQPSRRTPSLIDPFPVPSPSSMPTASTPSSPIIFSSPTSSRVACPFYSPDQFFETFSTSSEENEASRSWDTSYGSEIVNGQVACLARDSDCLPLSALSFQEPEPVVDSRYTASPESSWDPLAAVPIDTNDAFATLPLSGNSQVALASTSSVDVEPGSLLAVSSSTHGEPWTLSLSAVSFDCFGSDLFSTRSPRSQSLTLSPVSSYGVEIGIDGNSGQEDGVHGHAVILPRTTFSPTSTTLSSNAFESPTLPLTTADVLGLSNGTAEPTGTGAAEYAAAVVSSAWGSDGHDHLFSPSIQTFQVDDTRFEPEIRRSIGRLDEEATEESGASSVRITDLVDVEFQPSSRERGVLKKIKTCTAWVKNFLSRSTKSKQVSQARRSAPRSAAAQHHHRAVRGEPSASVYSSTLETLGVEGAIPLPLAVPPGLNPSTPSKTRPSLSAQTFTSPSSPMPTRISSPSISRTVPLIDTESAVRPSSNVHRLSFVNPSCTYPRPSSPRSALGPSADALPTSATNRQTSRTLSHARRRFSQADAHAGQWTTEFDPHQRERPSTSTPYITPSVAFENCMIPTSSRKERRRFSLSTVSSIFLGQPNP